MFNEVKSPMRYLLAAVCVLLVLFAIVCVGNIEAEAAEYIVAFGDDDLACKINTTTGVFTVSGSGAMWEYDSYTDFPWYEDRNYIKRVVIEDGVTSICPYAFYGCTNLNSITISDSVTSIGENAFLDTGYYNNSSNWQNGVLYAGKHLITAKKDINGGYTVKNGTVNIADKAFSDCSTLGSVIIPDSVKSIGFRAFYNCGSLSGITVGDNVSVIGREAFHNTAYYNNSSNWQDDVLYIGKSLISAKTSIKGDYTIKEGTKVIAGGAFDFCTGMSGITIPDSVTSIGERAFRLCTALTRVTIPDSVTSIGDQAFTYCVKLSDVVIGDGLTSIGKKVFNCSGLKSVTLGKNVTSIGEQAFSDCVYLSSITIPESVTRIAIEAFRNCTVLTSVTFEATEGWTVENGKVVSSSLLADPSTAATYLRAAHHWVRTVTHTHEYTAVVTAPTCTEQGYTTHTCECGESYIDAYVEGIGHDYGSDGVCVGCGELSPDDGNDINDGSAEAPKGGCFGGAGMYVSYLFTVLIPASLLFLGKHLFI